MRDLKHFFDELVPRLETAQALERELDAHLARRFNVLDYLRTDELGLSRIVADLLNPEGKHGQGATFLNTLLDGCGLQDHAPLGAPTAVEVEIEKTIKNDRRLDIFVRIDDHCLAIENKPYAGDQPCQVRDYLDWLRDEGFKKYALVYLSPSGEPPSSGSVELSYLEGIEGSDHFKIMPYYSATHDEWGDGFDEYRPQYTLAAWFADCRKNCAVDRLCWFLREAEAFCTQRFGGHTVGDNEFKAIKSFVVGGSENWDASRAVHCALPQIMKDVSKCFMEMVWNAWPEEYEYPDDVRRCLNYYSDRTKSCLGMYRKSWKSCLGGSGYKNEEKYTQIRLEAESGVDRWSIGIRSDNPQLIGKDSEGFKKLAEKLTSASALGSSEADYPGWVWWQWIDDEYQNWNVLIPELHRECENGSGQIMTYFVRKFAAIAEVAIPIIDCYEGS